jgi:hypothetical protein
MTIHVGVEACQDCGTRTYLVDGLCHDCRELVVHPSYLAAIYATPSMHKKSARCPICRGDGREPAE